jgi:WD40 repeat protein
MKKSSRYTLYLVLSVLGLIVGQHLHNVVSSRTPEVLLQVGEDLIAGQMSPDGRYLAGVGGKDGSWFVQIWDDRGRVVMKRTPLVQPLGRHHGFDWSPDSADFAISAGDQVWVFQAKDGSKQVLPASSQVRTVEYDGPFLMARAKTATFVWKNKKAKPYWRLDQGYLLHSTVNGETGRLVTACFEDGVRVFDLKRKRQLFHFQPGLTSAGLEFDARGLRLASGFRNRGNRQLDHTLVYNLESGSPMEPTLVTPRLFGYRLSANGKKLVSRQHAGAFVWNVDNGQNVAHREGQSTLIDALSRDGKWVASALGGGRVSLWSTEGKTEHQLHSDQPATDVRFAGPGRLLTFGGQATLWKFAE